MNWRFSPRLVLGVALIALVIVVVVVGRLLPHGRSDTPGAAADGRPVPTSASQASSSSNPIGGTSGSPGPLLHEPIPPSTPPGTTKPEMVARSFALAWLNHSGVSAQQWLDAMAPYATTDLRSQLVDVDPGSVPANRLVSAVSIEDDTATDCVAQAPTDTGTLRLTLRLIDGNWLVSDVDWDRA